MTCQHDIYIYIWYKNYKTVTWHNMSITVAKHLITMFWKLVKGCQMPICQSIHVCSSVFFQLDWICINCQYPCNTEPRLSIAPQTCSFARFAHFADEIWFQFADEGVSCDKLCLLNSETSQKGSDLWSSASLNAKSWSCDSSYSAENQPKSLSVMCPCLYIYCYENEWLILIIYFQLNYHIN